jgi:hypothetical protein
LQRSALYENPQPEIRIIDPKAHGVGFHPPQTRQKVGTRGANGFMTCGTTSYDAFKNPAQINVPQMMRLNIITYNVLKMLGNWEVARPYNFLLLPMVDPLFGHAFDRRANEKILLVCPFSSK